MKKVLVVILLLLNAYTQTCICDDATSGQQHPEWITIFIHGIISVKPYLNVPNVVKFVRDKIANTTYAHTIELTRRDPFFYQQHPMLGLGLQKIDQSIVAKGAAASAYANLIDKIDQYNFPNRHDQYYSFGWSGLLSPRMRMLEAEIFYNHMLKEFGNVFNTPQRPKIRMICYSHGGNVALKLAEVCAKEGYGDDKKIIVDELILIGVPVLAETDYLVNSPLFKKIYHFYSYGDRVQRMDCFSLHRMFSNRIFHARSDFTLPKKLLQINVRIKRPIRSAPIARTHQEKLTATKKYRTLRTADPGHSELWSFGWTPLSYRSSFPLNPLPFALFTPYIIAQLEKQQLNSGHCSVELHPRYEQIVMYDFLAKKEYYAPFIQNSELEHLKEYALLYKPDNFNREIYHQRICTAKREARIRWLAEKNTKKRLRRHV